ncbi:MAG: DUF624 domain-containing protein [Ruminococcus sp.]|nr:DUF624 domain-containing protein [Ruminococcus sp.]
MGLFFKNYDDAGPGISKNEPKKKGAARFFDLFGRKFWSLMWLNIHYFLAFIPLFLMIPVLYYLSDHTVQLILTLLLAVVFAVIIGPATAGMMRVLRLFFIEKHSFISRDFFVGVRKNFKKAAIIGALDCLILLSAYASSNVYPVLAMQYSKLFYLPMVLTFSIFLIVFMMNFYIFLMLTATDLPLKDLLKNSFTLSISSPKRNLTVAAVFIAVMSFMAVLLLKAFPLFTLLLPIFPAAFLGFVVTFICYPMIQKYIIDPYYTDKGMVNPEYLTESDDDGEEPIFEDMGGKEAPIEKRKKSKGKVSVK